MKTYSKPVVGLALMVLLLVNNGCMTMCTLKEAKGSSYTDSSGKVVVDKESNPALYALLPLAVAGDIATSPVQLGVVLLFMMSGARC